MIKRAIELAGAACLGLAACGSGSDDTAAPAGDASAAATVAAADPCSYVTADEVSAIVGDKVQGTEADGQTCSYKTASDDGVSLLVDPTGGKDKMLVARDSAKVLGGMGQAVADQGGAGKDVAGMLAEDTGGTPKLGDEAMWQANNQLGVRKGAAYVEVTPPIMHDPMTAKGNPLMGKDEKRAIAVKVAERALAKL